LITILDTILILLLNLFGKLQELFFAVLILIMFLCFLINLIMIKPDYVDILKGLFIPKIPENSYREGIALIGSIIMPHNLYLHSSLVKSKNIDRNNFIQIKSGLKLSLHIMIIFYKKRNKFLPN
jgi:NRAMP (natural resistance-associated macrophage protein)-like metal ion transporter